MLKIKEEFKSLIPPLTKDEFIQLERNCLEEGLRDAIITWEGYIIDGHNRYEIIQKHNLDFKTTEMFFDNDRDVKCWMIFNQFGRRNLSNYQRSVLALQLEEVFSKKAKENLSKAGSSFSPKEGLAKWPKVTNKINTREELSKVAQVGERTLSRVKKIQEKATEEVKAKLSTGEVSINSAYQEIKKEEKKEELEQIRLNIQKEVKKVDIEDISETFDVIYADPPWRYDFAESSNRKIENHYTTMQTSDIAKMKVPSKENCVLFMWATAPKLLEALDVMKSWGFTYKTHAIWDKEKIGMGYWFRGQHELLMVGVKGKVSPPQASIRISSIIKEQRSKHSRKPDCVAEYIELAFYDKSKVELFCREPRNGWYSYGNEIE